MTSDRDLFDRIAAHYCAKDLHAAATIARRHRLHRTLGAAGVTAEARVLEIGCGAGFSAAYLQGHYRRYVGVDYSTELIDLARRYNAHPEAAFHVADAARFQPGERFDLVFMIGVLHHFDDIGELLMRIRAWLEPGGLLVANEPHSGNPAVRLARRIRKRIDPSYSSDQRELSAHELRSQLSRAGFEQVKIVPQGLFSTPFAEVPVDPARLTAPLVRAACAVDNLLERRLGRVIAPLSWNLIAVGRQPR
jgi:SAM-dependent methyltransferase